jgi:Protein of unknown function (DUF1566)
MRAHRPSKLVSTLARVPVAVLGVAITVSAVQASCLAKTDDDGALDGGDEFDAHIRDGRASADSPSDLLDGMSYGDGYGKEDAHTGVDASCTTSTVQFPPSMGCPSGNHTWACWPAPPVTGGIPDSNYQVLKLCGQNVVVDNTTRLMWDQVEKPSQYSWVEAAGVCTSSRRGGFSDWRLPTSNELMSIVDYSRASPPLANTDVFVFDVPGNHSTWSSTACAQQPGSAWELLGVGEVDCYPVATTNYVRCVR